MTTIIASHRIDQVNIVLDSAQVDYRPTMINLTHVINIVTKELMGTIKAVSRVREVLGDGPNPNASTSNIKKSAPAAAATGAADAPGATSATEPTEAPPGAPAADKDREGGATGAAGVGVGVGVAQAAGEGVGGEGGGGGGSLLPVAQVRTFQRWASFPGFRAACSFDGVPEFCCLFRCLVVCI